MRYGAARYGRKYELATRITGYEHQTLLNMVYVATRFENSRRRENLSWSHHAELAALDRAEQEYWLERATAQRLTLRQLRCALLAARQSLETVPNNGGAANEKPEKPVADDYHVKQLERSRVRDAGAENVVSCPRCGHVFTGSDPASDVVTSSDDAVSERTASDGQVREVIQGT